MSYLARLSARAVGTRAGAPAVLPKGLGAHQAPNIARQQEAAEEDETLAPMRQFSARQPVRREEDEPEEVSRQETEEDPEAQRQTDEGREEEEIAPLRRQESEGEEEIAPLRRQEVEEDPEARPRRILARQEEIPLEDNGQRAPPLAQTDNGSGAESPSQELAGEREPTDLQALRRDVSPPLIPSTLTPAAQGAGPEERPAKRPLAQAPDFSQPQAPPLSEGLAIPHVVTTSAGAVEPRPTVVIDQLDVLIQEPAVPAGRNPPRLNRERALRARYLRRL